MTVYVHTLVKNRYLVQKLLKQEPGLTTCLVLDQEKQQTLVLKELRLQTLESWKALELFQREVALLKQLDHPQIPPCLEAFEIETPQGQNFYLVTALAPGQSLQEKLDSGWRADESQARQIGRQLLEILNYLHRFSPPVIHRDLKPANLMIDESQQVYVIDFGTIQTVLNPQGGSTIVGTFGFMPPEQYLGQAVPASDLYALGATLLQLMTGTEPGSFNYDGLRLDLKKLLPHCSEGWQQWLAKILEPELEERFRHADEALLALDNLAENTHHTSERIQIRRRGQALLIDIAPVGNWHSINWQTSVMLLLLMGCWFAILWGIWAAGIKALFFTFYLFLGTPVASIIIGKQWIENTQIQRRLILRPQTYHWQRSWKKWQWPEQGYTRHLSKVECDISFLGGTKTVFLNSGAGHRIPLFKTNDFAETQKVQAVVSDYLAALQSPTLLDHQPD